VCFEVCHKSWITSNASTGNLVSNCKKSAKETHEILKLVYGDAAVTTKTVYKWFERFRNGCESVEDGGEIGTSFNIIHPRECSKSKRNDSVKQANDYWGNF